MFVSWQRQHVVSAFRDSGINSESNTSLGRGYDYAAHHSSSVGLKVYGNLQRRVSRRRIFPLSPSDLPRGE